MAYSANFEICVRRTLAAEVGGTDAGDSDHPSDRGGRTRFGITELLAEAHGYDVRTLTRDQAVAIYHAEFWAKLGLDRISSVKVAFEIFDTAVNMGRRRAVEFVQRACWFFGFYGGNIDGMLGPLTTAAINRAAVRYERQLVLAMNGFQFRHYYDICDDNPSQREAFFRGWMLRLEPWL